MQQVIATFLLLSVFLITAPAYKLPEDDFTVEAAFGVSSREAAEEAILVGHILRIAASELEKDDTEDNEVDEYSFRTFWAKLKEAVRKGAEKAAVFFYDLGKEVKSSVKEVVKAAADAAVEVAKEKAKEKAVLIVTKIMDKIASQADSSELQSNGDFIKHLSKALEQVGRSLIGQGSEILRQ
ncbi:uncharacterized protein LOC119385673 [Rhipicephalus sanguineus]|uniref:uncharacterized protein LOC119385673 n=1 Tax=Rhipicephalus sanguineus TaxID=34632 RepID=UPI0020C44A3F|nr:uncharacterized protein LOC119385673 [Rhipicephalus sanguineus]XP_049270312.1 uncharacterized protein LOC119385673 [Rhipicephalus sanguineus]